MVLLLAWGCPGDTAKADAETPCANGTWGALDDDPWSVLHVREGGTGDGSLDAPSGSIEAALASGGTVFVGPGTFPSEVLVEAANTSLYGCGPDETVLTTEDAGDPTGIVLVDGVTGVVLDGFSFDGGRRALGILGAAEVDVSDVTVTGSELVGVLVAGAATVRFADLSVSDVVPEALTDTLTVGYGVSIAGGGGVRASIMMEGGEITGSTAVGVLADAVDLTMDGVTVSGTLPYTVESEPTLGRGLQIQNFSSAILTGCTIAENADTGIFVSTPDLFELRDSDVSSTLAAGVPDIDTTTGDGVVVRRDDDSTYPVDWLRVVMTGNRIASNERAGAVFENVLVEELSGNSGDNGFTAEGSSFVQQGETDATAASDPVGAPEEDLLFNLEELAPDTGVD